MWWSNYVNDKDIIFPVAIIYPMQVYTLLKDILTASAAKRK